MQLPHILLAVTKDVFHASGETPVPWSIRAEAETDTAARTSVLVNALQVADITVHSPSRETLVYETQTIAAALVWSALRATLGHSG